MLLIMAGINFLLIFLFMNTNNSFTLYLYGNGEDFRLYYLFVFMAIFHLIAWSFYNLLEFLKLQTNEYIEILHALTFVIWSIKWILDCIWLEFLSFPRRYYAPEPVWYMDSNFWKNIHEQSFYYFFGAMQFVFVVAVLREMILKYSNLHKR